MVKRLRLWGNIKKKINIKLISVIFIGIILLASILTVTSTMLIRSVFEKLYTEKLMISAHVLQAQYTPEDFLPFIETLKQNEKFNESAKNYLSDKLYILETETGADGKTDFPDDYYAAKSRMAEYRKEMGALKDEKYYSLFQRLLEVREGTGVKYLYVIADMGFDEMYVYLFDAVYLGDTVNTENDDFGTVDLKTNYPKIEQVFKTGEAVLEYGSYGGNTHSGALCYSYTPLLDDSGNIIAVIGADINLQSLDSQLNNFLIFSIISIISITGVITIVIILMLGRIIIKPIRKLTDISGDIASGNIYASIPEWITKRTDEMGTLGRSYESMNTAVRDMYTNNNMLFEATISGKLDTRIDSSRFQGFFAQLVEKMNDTLDIVGLYFDSIPGTFVVLNSDYDIVYTNQHFKQVFPGFTLEFLWQKMLSDTENSDLGSLKKKFADILQKGEYTALVSFEIENKTRWVTFLCNKISNNNNNNGAVIVVWDNTELVLNKDKALLANKAKSEFLSRVSHELRTPMNVIMSMAKFGVNDTDYENNKERFIKIVSASNHLARIINDVLDMSRMESGKTEIRYAPLNLSSIIESCTDLLMLKAREKNLDFTYFIDPSIPSGLIGDEFRIRQILINLITNAIKFTDQGQVAIRVEPVSESADKTENKIEISFSVIDTGVGISEEFQKKIFMPFEQEDLFLNRRYEGTGLGLSISHDLVLLMGGSMQVESKLGQGSKFTFNIPFEKQQPAQTESHKSIKDGEVLFDGKRILLVDDIEINRMIVFEILADSGLEIDEAADGQEAFEIFGKSAANYYDCILMDIQMPKMDGYETTKVIRGSNRADKDVPIIAMTANALKEDVDNAINCGMNDHIAKPLDFDEVIAKLRKYLY